jgi:hypothetical protein
MKKILLLSMIVLLINCSTFAVLKTWVGASGGTWSTGSNWSPSGAPLSTDDVQITSATIIALDVNPSINSILISASGIVQFTTSASRTVTVSSTSTTTPGLQVNAGATLQLTSNAAVTLDMSLTGSSGVTGRIYGTLWFTGSNTSATAKLTLFSGALSNGNMIVYSTGIIQYDLNTGNTTGFGLTGFQMEAGSQYIINRNGAAMPAGTYKDGSIIRINGVVSSGVTFNTTATYQGLIIWNCPSQTISGSSAVILPSSSFALIDSIRIVSTGTGTVRLTTSATAFVIGHLEVQGGTLEISTPGSANGTGTITNGLKITGGNVIGNATYAFDNLASYPMSLTLSGTFTMTGGSFNLTNRPTANAPGGAFLFYVAGNVAQTGGTISSTSSFGSQNQINCNGTIAQNLELSNFTGSTQLVINNTNGVFLQNNLVLPSYLHLAQGYLQLNANNCTITYPQIVQDAVVPIPKIVTNGFGKLRVLSMPASSSVVFPVAYNASTYNPVTIASQSGAITNDYFVRVENGNNPSGIFNTNKTINRTWIINTASTIMANTVDCTFGYAAADANAGCTPSSNMELGHFVTSSWSLDPAAVSRTPVLGTYYTAGLYAPNTLDSAFVLGNVGSILIIKSAIVLSGTNNNNLASLYWNTPNNYTFFDVEVSTNGRTFTTISSNVNGQYFKGAMPYAVNYYRIKAINNNGKIEYSNVVSLANTNANDLIVSLLPNPVMGSTAQLAITSLQSKWTTIVVTDISGRVVSSLPILLSTGYNAIALNATTWAKGMYKLIIRTDKKVLKTVLFQRL